MYTIEIIVAIVAVIIGSVVIYFKRAFGYWKKKNVEYLDPSIPLGNLENPLFPKNGFIGLMINSYREFKSRGQRFGGIYLLGKPIFIPTDPDLVKSILAKDFSHFMNHGNLIDVESEPLTGNLLNVEDEKWRNLRTQLTPTFSSGKIKMMFSSTTDCCDQMVQYVRQLSAEKKPLQIKDIVSRYTIDVIGTCAFGMDCNSFKRPDAEIRRYSKKLIEQSLWAKIRLFMLFVMPDLNKIFKFKVFDKESSEFFSGVFKAVLENRVSANSKRNDFIQLLLDMNAGHAKPLKSLNTDEMIAQSFGFFLAGFETSSSNMAFCLYKLACHQEVQERVRQEVRDVLGHFNGVLCYEALGEMTYMDQVIDETLRFYPPLPFLNRKCSKEYVVPGTDVKIEKDKMVMISVMGFHMDEEYYPNPEKFDPDRFTKENKSKRHQYVHIPFGDGPRICLGQRFAIMQIKIGLSSILSNFKILPHASTPKSISFSPSDILITCSEKLLLNAQII